MEFNNVNLWFAKNKNNKIVTIDEINDNNKHDIYTCPICGSEVIARLGDKKVHHFAHKDKSKCNSETMIHWWVKNKLIEVGDSFSIKLSNNNIKNYICKEIYIENQYKTLCGVYKPDITIVTNTNETIYIEIECTNKKKIEEYLDRWMCLKNIVVEVSVKDMINNNINELKTIFYKNKCYNIHKTEEMYSKTIGEYKQKIIDTEGVKKAKKRLDGINWFWEECKKYRTKKTDENTFFNVIDILQEKDREYVVNGLLKSNCTDVRRLYLYNKQKEIYDYINSFNENNDLDISICKKEELFYSKTFEKRFRIPVVYSDTLDDIYRSDIFCKEKLDLILNRYCFYNKVLLEFIANFNYKDYKLSQKYNNRGTEKNIKLDILYNNYYVFDIEIDLSKQFDIKEINNVVINEIEKYREELNICSFKDKINEYLIDKNNTIKNINKIRGSEVFLYCDTKCKENKLDIWLAREDRNNNKDYLFTIQSYEMFVNVDNPIHFNSYEDFKTKADKLISDKIRKIRYDI